VLEPHRAFILERIRQTPHLTLHGLKDRTRGARGVRVSHNTVWLFLRREGQRFQKKRCSPLSRPAPMSPAGGGAGGRGKQAFDPRRLVFIDETWIKTSMAPLVDGARRVIACEGLRRMAIGAR